MTKSALAAIFTIGVAKTLPLGLDELRRHCLVISIAVQIFVLPMITIRVCVHELSPVLLHALPFEVTFRSIEKEDVRLVLVSGVLTLIMRDVWLEYDGFAQLEPEKLLDRCGVPDAIHGEENGYPFIQEQFNAIVSHPVRLHQIHNAVRRAEARVGGVVLVHEE